MTLLFQDGCDWAGAAAELLYKYDNNNNMIVSTTLGRFGEGTLRGQFGGRYIDKDISASVTVIVAFSFWTSAISNAADFLILLDSAGGTQITVGFTSALDGTIEIRRGATVIATSTNAMAVSTWYRVEVKVTIDNASGSAEVQVDGTSWANFSSGDTQNTANANVGTVRFGCHANESRHDDIIIMDSSGTKNNDYLGDTRIHTLRPTSDVESDFTPSTGGDNFAMVDDADVDDDSTYVESSTLNHRDRYGFGDLPVTPTTIFAVGSHTVARKDDAGARELQNLVELSASELSGSSVAISSSYLVQQDIFETKPGGGDWTASDVNAMTAGYEVSV